jgi:hypothetical protein
MSLEIETAWDTIKELSISMRVREVLRPAKRSYNKFSVPEQMTMPYSLDRRKKEKKICVACTNLTLQYG